MNGVSVESAVQFFLAETSTEFQNARDLVRRVYTGAGYIDAHSTDAELFKYIGQKGTLTMLAYLNGELVGTISVVSGESKLPMDIIFRDELDSFRTRGAHLGEACQFAVDKVAFDRANDKGPMKATEFDVSLGLYAMVFHYGMRKGLDYFCFAINPKHRRLYESFGAYQIGNEKQYPSVNKAPALAYLLDVHELKQKKSTGLNHFILEKIFSTRFSKSF